MAKSLILDIRSSRGRSKQNQLCDGMGRVASETDNAGNVTSYNTAMGSVVKQVDYAYDYMNRMVKRTYDADGAGAGAAVSQYWVYDNSINAVLQFDGASASNLAHRYLWENAVDQLLSDEQVSSLGSGGNTLWALADNIGSIRDIADLNEGTGVTTVTNHRIYNSFGKLTSETNSAVDLIFGYTGKQLDEATTYQHNLNRWYDSNIGQWLNEDPKGFEAGDANLRRYVNNNTLTHVDPTGLDLNIPGRSGPQENGTIDDLKRKSAALDAAITQNEADLKVERAEQSRLEAVAAARYTITYLTPKPDQMIDHDAMNAAMDKANEEASNAREAADVIEQELNRQKGEKKKVDEQLKDIAQFEAWLLSLLNQIGAFLKNNRS